MAVKFEKVRQIALALDGVEEGSSYGTPGFKVKGVLFLRLHQVWMRWWFAWTWSGAKT